MGLIQAFKNALGGQVGDQWRDYFECESIPNNVLMTKGRKRTSNTRQSSNTKAEDNIISNGSIVSVHEGQCMIIVDNGKIVEFCAEAGEFVYDTSTEPSLLYGNLGENLGKSFATFGRRFTFGGDTARTQYVYYFNTKEIMNNPFGTANPIPFRVVDKNINLDMDVSLRCHGKYTFKIVDPILFYTHVAGNVRDSFVVEGTFADQMKLELVDAMTPALGKISELGIRYSQISNYPDDVKAALNEVLSPEWTAKRGITIVSIALSPMTLSEEDAAVIKQYQQMAMLRDPNMAAASLVQSQSKAMVAAAENKSTGPMMALAGMNMAQQTGGMNANALFAMGQQQNQQMAQQQSAPQMAQQQPVQQVPQQSASQVAPQQVAGWTCTCGMTGNTGKFCKECGTKRVEPQVGWTCSCGALNTGKFCVECGTKKPADAPLYKCDKCGWEPEDPKNPPKFCPECGDPFNDDDIK